MITDTIVGWFAAFIGWLGGLVSVPGPPSFLVELPGWVTTASSYVAGTSVWMPWSLMVTVIGVYAVCLTSGLAIKLVRIVASFLTAGGGSAA
ncbi:MAG: hypothetical protein QOI54_1830 [Actinomycetota bacterium]|jgi:hypothetical protein|nr:hypothetical protein [Actinomycetota bacterium]